MASEITAYLENVRKSMWEDEEQTSLPSAMTDNAYERAQRLTIREICPRLDGFRADTNEKEGHLDHFKNGWIGSKEGDRLLFETEASCIAVQYRKTIRHPARKAEQNLDGDTKHPVLLEGNFDEDWGDSLTLTPVLVHGKEGAHTVEIRLISGDSTMPSAFELISVIVSEI